MEHIIKCIHYGTPYEDSKFQEVKNSWSNKPDGGLWVSPIGSSYGWKEWCINKGFENWVDIHSYELSITGRILVIDSKKDLNHLILQDKIGGGMLKIDYEAILKDHDAIYLTRRGEKVTKFNGLCGWDCESILILNKKAIIIT